MPDLPNWEDATPEQREGFAMAIRESIRDGSLLAKIARDEQAAKNAAYRERDQLVALISSIWPSWLGRHEGEWQDAWRNIVYVQTPAGQLSWHIHDSEMPLFDHLAFDASKPWDGHTTEEKYERIRKLVTTSGRGW